MKHRFGPKQTRLNVDLVSKHSAMVEFLKKGVRNDLWCGINEIFDKTSVR
ncbi:MAG: hypothetical protein WCA61_13475 [Nitrososphaeraceae archaeon]